MPLRGLCPLLLALGTLLLPPAAGSHVANLGGAVEGACVDHARSLPPGAAAEVLMPPLATLLSFAPECTLLAAQATVSFANRDGGNHWPRSRTGPLGQCFDAGALSPGAGKSVSLAWEPASGTLAANGVPCDARTFERDGELAVLRYHCRLHPGTMQAVVVLRA